MLRRRSRTGFFQLTIDGDFDYFRFRPQRRRFVMDSGWFQVRHLYSPDLSKADELLGIGLRFGYVIELVGFVLDQVVKWWDFGGGRFESLLTPRMLGSTGPWSHIWLDPAFGRSGAFGACADGNPARGQDCPPHNKRRIQRCPRAPLNCTTWTIQRCRKFCAVG